MAAFFASAFLKFYRCRAICYTRVKFLSDLLLPGVYEFRVSAGCTKSPRSNVVSDALAMHLNPFKL